jgi:hypothetical protein
MQIYENIFVILHRKREYFYSLHKKVTSNKNNKPFNFLFK